MINANTTCICICFLLTDLCLACVEIKCKRHLISCTFSIEQTKMCVKRALRINLSCLKYSRTIDIDYRHVYSGHL